MPYEIRKIAPPDFPALLQEIPDAPKQLYVRGTLAAPPLRTLAVVGSRAITPYAKAVCDYLIGGLAGYPISIVSGLALGVDAYAHEAALQHQLHTIAVPGSGIADTAIIPPTNRTLAKRIIDAGGALMSELEPEHPSANWTFPRRNRIMAGMADAVLIIEAREKSGTLITAKLTVDYNRTLLIVPNSIFADSSKGALQFLKLGGTPVTTPADILDALGIDPVHTNQKQPHTLTKEEAHVYELLREPTPRDALIEQLEMPVSAANVLLSAMELKDVIEERLGKIWRK